MLLPSRSDMVSPPMLADSGGRGHEVSRQPAGSASAQYIHIHGIGDVWIVNRCGRSQERRWDTRTGTVELAVSSCAGEGLCLVAKGLDHRWAAAGPSLPRPPGHAPASHHRPGRLVHQQPDRTRRPPGQVHQRTSSACWLTCKDRPTLRSSSPTSPPPPDGESTPLTPHSVVRHWTLAATNRHPRKLNSYPAKLYGSSRWRVMAKPYRVY